MRRRVREDTEILEPLIAQPEIENNRRLDDIFVDLVICTGRAQHEFTDLSNRHEIFDIYLKPQDESISIKKLEELFLPNRDTQDPRKILIVGRPGIGKSLLCTKLSHDWSKGDLLRDGNKSFEHLFLFHFRNFNTETEKISLKQLLNRLHTEGSIDGEVFQYMLDNPEKILLIFDGLDEFKHHKSCLEDEQAQVGNSPTEEMTFSALYVKLLKGKQISGATVLTTCRPNVVQSVSSHKFDRMVEIMGFTPEKVQEYVHKFCAHDAEAANKMWGHISSNLELLSLCYIPVNSFIVCSILEELIKLQEQDSRSSLPTTSTEIYNGALRLFIFKCHPEFKGKQLTRDYLMGNAAFSDSVEETLSSAELLAKTGIEESRLVFDSTEVQGMENCGLFNRMPDSKVSPSFTWKSHFCFIHLTLQELLAAREIAKMEPNDLGKFIMSNASDPKWHLVIQFVAGLLCGQENEAVNSFVKLLCETLTEILKSSETKQKALLMIKCLHEYSNEATVKKAASELQKNSKFSNGIDLSSCQVTLADCSAIVYFIKQLHELTELDLCANFVTDQGVSHLCDSLKDVNSKLTTLDISNNSITDQGVSHLCNALTEENSYCKLSVLNLTYNKVTDQGISQLCDALKTENCKLTVLNLSYNNITDQGVSHLCDALKADNCKLTELYLSHNNITDKGVLQLCDVVKDVNCKLTRLGIVGNKITEKGVSDLCVALKDINCKLSELTLTGTKINDQSVMHLCNALKDENCKLTELNLSHNKFLLYQHVSHLCDALKDEKCKLSKLNLSACDLGDLTLLSLCDALKHINCKLTNLDLYGGSMTGLGLQLLCDALKDENCKLKELELGKDGITDQIVSNLCDALKDGNCKLEKLGLSQNSITDQGALHLCDALKNIHCKLTSLKLCENSLTDEGVSHLCDALKDVSNCKLIILDLRYNNITEQGISHLCGALKDVNCKLIKLYLGGNNMTDQGVSHLCDAIKNENCKLTKLSLYYDNITAQGILHLRGTLKHVNCKLTKLSLARDIRDAMRGSVTDAV